MSLVKILPLGLAVTAALSLGVSAHAQLPGAPTLLVELSFSSQLSFLVQHVEGNAGSSSVSGQAIIVGGPTPPPPARVAVDVPSQYAADLTGAPGATVGLTIASSAEASAQSLSILQLLGPLTAVDPAQYAADPAAQACAPGPYLAVWRFTSAVLGLNLSLPIFVVHPSGSTTGVELRFCTPTLTTQDGKSVTGASVTLDDLGLLLSTIMPPTSTGDFLWHAFVTPQTPGTGAPNEAATYELRAEVPVPHTVAVKARYDSKGRDAVLSGVVKEAGKPQANVDVLVANLEGFQLFHRRTDAQGRFTLKERISGTTRFDVEVLAQTEACQGSSTAPGGCLGQTISPPPGKRVRVVVPRH